MNFIKGLQTEYGKLVWPKPAEAFGLAAIVIVIAVVIGYYLGALDAFFAMVLRAIIG
ncbi:MAG: SecE/Sec61-gamma subunit of protein translocation complex [Patescibacteria group bacterium]|nr:SecE/Sec61-gamma subunit of protein translocation complex [Patescibacteria group bacterium]